MQSSGRAMRVIYGKIALGCVYRKRSVGAAAFIGPNPPAAVLFAADAQAARTYLPPAGKNHRCAPAAPAAEAADRDPSLPIPTA